MILTHITLFNFIPGATLGAQPDTTVDRTTGGGPPKVMWGYWLPSKYYDFSDPFKSAGTGDEQRLELAKLIRAEHIRRGIVVDDMHVQAQAAIQDAVQIAAARVSAPATSSAVADERAQAARAAYMDAYKRAYRDAYTQEIEQQLSTLFALEVRERRLKRNAESMLLMIVAMS